LTAIIPTLTRAIHNLLAILYDEFRCRSAQNHQHRLFSNAGYARIAFKNSA